MAGGNIRAAPTCTRRSTSGGVHGLAQLSATTAQEQTDYAANVAADETTEDRESAKTQLDTGGNKALRALAELVLSEINLLRAEHAMPARTREQLKTAMETALDNGDAD